MKPLLRVLAEYAPPFLKKQLLKKLLRVAAEAFGSAPPPIRGFTANQSLAVFAAFTRREAGEAVRSGKDLETIRRTLYGQAYRLGAECRKWLRIGSIDDVMSAARLLYGFCGIDFQGTENGEVTIPRCFFSGYYSSEVCGLISSLDAGLLAGLSGGARRLTFNRRITEGAPACTAVLAEGRPE